MTIEVDEKFKPHAALHASRWVKLGVLTASEPLAGRGVARCAKNATLMPPEPLATSIYQHRRAWRVHNVRKGRLQIHSMALSV